MSTASLTKPKSAAATAVWPQVDLLPPEVRAGRRLGQTKRLLALVVLGVVLLALLGWVYAKFTLDNADQELADAQNETTRLTAEQAKYAEVPRIQSQLSQADTALSSATGTEVLWKPYFEALRAVTPPNVSYDTLQVTMGSDPNAAAASDPLQQPSLGQIAFTARAAKLPDVAAWMDAVKNVPGLSDPWFTQGSVTDKDGTVYYQVTGTVQITGTALAHRFDEKKAGSGDAGTVGTAPTGSPSAAPNGGNS